MAIRKKGIEEEDADIDLKPIMGLICILIPLLVYGFSFYEIKVQPVAAPKLGAPSSGEAGEEEKKPLNLTVLLTSQGFVVKMDASLAVEQGLEADMNIPKKDFRMPDGKVVKEFDFPELYNRLIQVKRKFRGEQTINIGADPDTPWSTIARVIDAARLELKEEKYSDLKSYSEASEAIDDEGKPKFLFPQVVFVVAE
jgi:biopolymer transport protein ExbD